MAKQANTDTHDSLPLTLTPALLSQRAVEKHLAALQQKGRLLRHGSPRAGTWQVL